MRTSAPLAAFVGLMAVASSNGAPLGTPNGSSVRSVSRARAPLRSRNLVPPPASNLQDVSYTADVPNLKCSDCPEKEVEKVSADAARPMADVQGDLKDMKNALVPSGIQASGVPSASGSIDINIDVDVNEDPNTGASTEPEEHPNGAATDNNDNTNNNASDGNPGGANNDDKVDESKVEESKTDNGQADDSGKTEPPAEQLPSDGSNIDLEDVQDELKKVDRVADDEVRDSMNDVESKSSQANDDVKTALSSTDIHELNDEVDNMAEVVGISQEPGSEKPEEITVEMRKGDSSVSAAVLRR